MSDSSSAPAEIVEVPRVVLGVPDEPWAAELSLTFRRAGFLPHLTLSPEVASLALSFRKPAVVIVDASFIRDAGVHLLDTFRLQVPDVPIVVVSGEGDEDIRLRALVHGADDAVGRPFSPEEIVLRVRRALERRTSRRTLRDQARAAKTLAERIASERDDLQSRLRGQLNVMQRAIDFQQRLTTERDPAALQRRFLGHLSTQIGVDRLALLGTPTPGAPWLMTRASWGMPDRLARRVRLPAHGELASLVTATGSALSVERLAGLPGLRVELGILSAGGFTAALPLLLGGRLEGLLLLGEARGGGIPNSGTLQLAQLHTSALVPALVAEERLVSDRQVTLQTLSVLVDHIEQRNPFLLGHGLRVARVAESIGRELGVGPEDLTNLQVAGLLHDVGRFELGPQLWLKRGPLTPGDWEQVRRHPDAGARLLAETSWPQMVLDAVRGHHERWDGAGYPEGKRGAQIPWAARVLALADAYDALRSERPFRAAMDDKDGLALLRLESGTKFDPEMTEILIRQANQGALATV